jgi:hypothetical protein
MKSELTYALDGRVLGIELPAGRHGRNNRTIGAMATPTNGRDTSSCQLVCGLLFGGCLTRAETLTWTLRLRLMKYPPPVPQPISLSTAPPAASIHSGLGYMRARTAVLLPDF